MVAVIDYGMGNLRSVSKALETVGAEVKVTNNPEEIVKAEAIVLPGVGAFYRGMENLRNLGILPAIFKTVEEGKPFLGICLGLQLLFTKSEEHGINKGLGLIKGKVRRFEPALKIPHMGWNKVKLQITSHKSQVGIFDGVPNNSYFYFVHSYYVEPEDKNVILAATGYGVEFASAVTKGNIFGVQFHPEKSTGLGLKILENFVKAKVSIQ